jgi:hypothetical protein
MGICGSSSIPEPIPEPTPIPLPELITEEVKLYLRLFSMFPRQKNIIQSSDQMKTCYLFSYRK